MRLYGLKNCDTCRKAMKMLTAAGKDVEFVDVRVDGLTEKELATFLETFGAALVNTRSTTWRGLSDLERKDAPLSLLLAYPALMKRPIIRDGDALTLGWDRNAQVIHLGDGA